MMNGKIVVKKDIFIQHNLEEFELDYYSGSIDFSHMISLKKMEYYKIGCGIIITSITDI